MAEEPRRHAFGGWRSSSLLAEPTAAPADSNPRRHASTDNRAAVEGIKRDVVIDRFRVPRSLEPTMLPEPSPASRSSSTFGMLIGLGGAIAGVTVVALLVVGELPGRPAAPANRPAEQAAGSVGVGTLQPAAQEAPAASARTSPQLVIRARAPAAVGDVIPLDIALVNAENADAVVLYGLPAGSNITSGRPLGLNGWRLLAFDLGNAAVRPPAGFVGGADVTVELRRGNRTIERRALHLEWTRSPTSAATSAVPATAIMSASTRRLPPDEVSVLVKRGEDLVANGDLAAARLLLQRAAEAEDASAALALAATYDPVVLEQRPIQGVAADAALARAWYEKAKKFGSAEASRRLDVLATSRDR